MHTLEYSPGFLGEEREDYGAKEESSDERHEARQGEGRLTFQVLSSYNYKTLFPLPRGTREPTRGVVDTFVLSRVVEDHKPEARESSLWGTGVVE